MVKLKEPSRLKAQCLRVIPLLVKDHIKRFAMRSSASQGLLLLLFGKIEKPESIRKQQGRKYFTELFLLLK